MSKIPIKDVDIPIKYDEFKKQVLERQRGLENDGALIVGITMHPKTARALLCLMHEKELINEIKPIITIEAFGLRVFPNTTIPETEYHFMVD